MAKSWTMTVEHAAHAEAFPPRAGYTCGAHSETYGGGCFNCGWNPERKPRKVTVSELDKAQARVMGAVETAFAFARTEVMLDSCSINSPKARESAARSWEAFASHIGSEALRGQVEHLSAMHHARDAAYRLSAAMRMGHDAEEQLESLAWHCMCVSSIVREASA